jgi:hypothetical protein
MVRWSFLISVWGKTICFRTFQHACFVIVITWYRPNRPKIKVKLVNRSKQSPFGILDCEFWIDEQNDGGISKKCSGWVYPCLRFVVGIRPAAGLLVGNRALYCFGGDKPRRYTDYRHESLGCLNRRTKVSDMIGGLKRSKSKIINPPTHRPDHFLQSS